MVTTKEYWHLYGKLNKIDKKVDEIIKFLFRNPDVIKPKKKSELELYPSIEKILKDHEIVFGEK